MKPFEPWLNRPGLKTVHGFHGSNQSIKKKLVNLLLLACLSVTLCILSLSALRSSISCLSIKFGSFFLSDREERATWDRENERSCWQKKKKGKKEEKNRNSQAYSGGCSSAEKNRNSLEVLSTHLKLSKKEVKEVEWSFDL